MQQKGIGSPRQLALKSGVSQPAIGRLIRGEGRQEDDTIARVADALGMELADMYRLAGLSVPEAAKYTPPAEANRLTLRQRKAIDELIRATVADLDAEAGESGATSTSPMNHAGDDADEVTQANRGRLEHGQQPVPNLEAVRRRQEQADTTPPEVIERMAADRERGDT